MAFLDLDAYFENCSTLKLFGKEYKIKDFSAEMMFDYQNVVTKYFRNADKIKQLMKKEDETASKQFADNIGLLHNFIFKVLKQDNEIEETEVKKLGINACLGIIQFLTLVINDSDFLDRAKKLGALQIEDKPEEIIAENPVVNPAEKESNLSLGL